MKRIIINNSVYLPRHHHLRQRWNLFDSKTEKEKKFVVRKFLIKRNVVAADQPSPWSTVDRVHRHEVLGADFAVERVIGYEA